MFQGCWQKTWCPGEAELIANQTWEHRVTFFCHTSTHTCTGQTWAVSVWFLPHTWMRGFYHHPSMQRGLMIVTVCPGWYLSTTWHNLESLEKKESRLRFFFFQIRFIRGCVCGKLSCLLMDVGGFSPLWEMPLLGRLTETVSENWMSTSQREKTSKHILPCLCFPRPAVAPPTDGLQHLSHISKVVLDRSVLSYCFRSCV